MKPQELLAALQKQLVGIAAGGCTCGAKSPQAEWHDAGCVFRRASEAIENAEALAARLIGKTITLVKTEMDWMGLYVGDECYGQSHSIRADHALRAASGLEAPFAFNVVWADDDWMEERSDLPGRLSDVKLRAS